MELAGLILGLIALLVGGYHIWEIRKALANLATVRNSLSTQYLGKFPGFTSNIIELMNSATHSLVVFCDFPGYADFSEPVQALEYRHAIERKRQQKVDVDVTCLDANSRLKYLREQFPEQKWGRWPTDPAKREAILRYVQPRSDRTEPEKLTLAELVQIFHDADESLIKQPFLKPTRQISLHMPIYFWIADEQRAIFSIPTLSDDAVEHGFVTSDNALIKALLEMHDRYKKESAPEVAASASAPPAPSVPAPPAQ